jgi:hypothetical protein
MLKKALFVVLVLPVLSAAAAPVPAASVQSVPQVMSLSSWQSEAVDGSIVGGTQTVTIVSTSATAQRGITFTLEVPPCDCTLASASTTSGGVINGVWTLAELSAGETASLDVVYVSRASGNAS